MTASYFTVTAGRTGTAWLADFLTRNLGVDVIHEPLGIEDFGVTMPDIRLMRAFNTYGNTEEVRAFWARKLDIVARARVYGEANHTLAKCGLIENLAASPLAEKATLVILRRDIVRQCVSYLTRNDFGNITLAWQWYLHPAYARKIVGPKPFLPMGQLGLALWYCYEMAARQAYYRLRYGDRLTILEADLESITKPEGAAAFWSALGGAGAPELPPPKNTNAGRAPERIVEQVRATVAGVNFDAERLAQRALAQGFTFDA
jgi:hypothetical protein